MPDRRPQRLLRCLLLLLSLSASAATARAQGQASDRARTHLQFRQAHEAIVRSDWDEARRLLLELWNQRQTYDVAASLAQVEFREKNYALSARYMTFALAHIPPTETPAKRQAFEEGIAEAQPHICTVTLAVEEPGAEVLADGQVIGTSPLPSKIYLDPGEHALEARLGTRVTAQPLTCAAGSTHDLQLAFPPAPAVAATPAANASVAPRSPAADLPRSRGTRAEKSVVPLYVGGAITLAGAATWLGYSMAAQDDRDEAEKWKGRLGPDGCSTGRATSSQCKAAAEAYDNQRRNAALAYMGLATSLVAGAATVSYWLFWPESTQGAVHVSVGPALRGGSLTVTGSF